MTQVHLMRRTVVLGLLLAVPAMAKGAKDVCGDRPDCIVKGTQRVLKGHEVVELSLGQGGAEDDERYKCEQKEWWLRRPDKSVVKLLGTCGDDPNSVMEDDVSVQKNRFSYTDAGGTRVRGASVVELQLVPLTWASGRQYSYDVLSHEGQEGRFNYITFEGRSTKESDDCQALEAQLVPRVQVPANFLSEGWKRMSLGRCSVDGSFVLLGKAQGKEDARIRAVLTHENVLLVEVMDDTWTGPGEKWLADDHVELWLSGWAPTSFKLCGDEADEEEQTGLRQWGIRIADGQVFPAYGNPQEPLPVEVVREGKVARLKIQLPGESGGLTVIYSDSDGGKKQELMVGTSPLRFGRAVTLSPVWQVSPAQATCEVKENQLVPVLTELRPNPGEAAISD